MGDEGASPSPVLLVTGLSGAGRTTVLRALEDVGFEAVDNLPLSLLERLLAAPADRPLAVGVDTRTRAFDPEQLLAFRAAVSSTARPLRLLFVDCNGAELLRRFSETRRRHPLAPDRPVADGIARERELLAGLRQAADLLIDTTDSSPNDLRRAVAVRFGKGVGALLTLTLLSFGYARGVPRDADLVFDLRFLRNPHWEDALRPLDGTDPRVAAFVAADDGYQPAFTLIRALLLELLPRYRREGRSYLTVAFGCTGGRHRSVAVAIAMGAALAEAGWPNRVVHRDRAAGLDEAGLEAGGT
ncbi:RNase adapter RapZ [Thermaurantiacus sp.]